jgi:uncharacterized protein YoaH (UPF0181 family)
MTPKLSPEIQTAMHQQPNQAVEVSDDSGAIYVVVPKATFVHLSNLSTEADATAHAELQQLIQQGMESGTSIPAANVFEELRQLAKALQPRTA